MAAMLPPSRDVDVIVRALYGSLLEDFSFERCLRVLARSFNAHTVALHTEERYAGRAAMEIFGPLDADDLVRFSNDYSTRWPGKNLWVERSYDTMLTRGFEDGDAIVSREELCASEYYQHFLHPLDMRHGIGIAVRTDAASVFSLVSLNRHAGAGAFDREDLALVAALRPHLVNAFSLYRRIASLQGRIESMRSSFDRLPLALLILDLDGRVLEHNAEASRFLGRCSEIRLAASGDLRLRDARAHARLRGFVARAGHPSVPPQNESIVLGDTFGELTVLHLCALPASTGGVLQRRGRVLASICLPGQDAAEPFAANLLRAAFELTHTESMVVLSLRHHHDPTEVAAELGLAVSTVRSHLKHAFRKSGTTRQGELLRLVDRLLASTPLGPRAH
jgi:DNA-binding CsgD family transcriptional regulator/PAS domain-containing protein